MIATLYDILEISPAATPAQIKAAFVRLAKAYHPDKHKGDDKFEGKFKEIHQAYEVLIDPEKRKRYDVTGQWTNAADNDESQIVKYLQTLMHAVIKQIIADGFDPSDRNILQYMRERLSEVQTQLTKDIRELKKVRDSLERIAAKLKHKQPDKENLLGKIATAPIESEINPCIESKTKELKTIKQCFTVLNNHRWTGTTNPFDFDISGWMSKIKLDGTVIRSPEEE